MIDDDDNYYDVSDQPFARIKNTGKPTYNKPVFMQKVKMPPTNPNFIQVGMVMYRDSNEVKALFVRRTKELEDAQNRAFDNFSKAMAPVIYERYVMCRRAEEDYEKFIAEQTAEKDKKIERLTKKYQREVEKIEEDYKRKIEFVKDMMLKRQKP